ncbi:MAG: PH domain-containing protein [Acidobacteriota bacterium]|nr:PH domain-containing protein [Acidobacteriota bacterium]
MKQFLLKVLKVSERPDPPPGHDEELITFHASRRYLYYSGVSWFFKQAGALLGILFSLAYFGSFEIPFVDFGVQNTAPEPLRELTEGLPDWFAASPLRFIELIEFIALGFFAIQAVTSGLLLKLGWELRWYMVGDECLRIREGLWKVKEQTMTISKIQNMSVRQNPLQKLLGIEDLEIHTAGGGAKSSGDGDEDKGLHVGHFRGIENGAELRAQIRARMARSRGSGLGDEGDHHLQPMESSATLAGSTGGAETLAAARELLDESRRLRGALGAGPSR